MKQLSPTDAAKRIPTLSRGVFLFNPQELKAIRQKIEELEALATVPGVAGEDPVSFYEVVAQFGSQKEEPTHKAALVWVRDGRVLAVERDVGKAKWRSLLDETRHHLEVALYCV